MNSRSTAVFPSASTEFCLLLATAGGGLFKVDDKRRDVKLYRVEQQCRRDDLSLIIELYYLACYLACQGLSRSISRAYSAVKITCS